MKLNRVKNINLEKRFKLEEAFYIDAYMKNGKLYEDTYIGNGELHTKGVHAYLERNNIYINENQMLLVGRALMDFTIEDILLTKSNNPIYIYKFHLYNHETDCISAGCTCAIICSYVSDEFNEGDILSLGNYRKRWK